MLICQKLFVLGHILPILTQLKQELTITESTHFFYVQLIIILIGNQKGMHQEEKSTKGKPKKWQTEKQRKTASHSDEC